MPTKRIVAFVIALLLTAITFLTAFMQTVCIVGVNDLENADLSDPDIHPGGKLLIGFSGILIGFYAIVMLCININFSIVSMALALANTKPSRCDVKWVRVTSWVIFGINCTVIAYSIIAIFFI